MSTKRLGFCILLSESGKMTHREMFFKDRAKIADLKRSRVSLNAYRRNPGEINYTSPKNIFLEMKNKTKNIFEKVIFEKIFFENHRFS